MKKIKFVPLYAVEFIEHTPDILPEDVMVIAVLQQTLVVGRQRHKSARTTKHVKLQLIAWSDFCSVYL